MMTGVLPHNHGVTTNDGARNTFYPYYQPFNHICEPMTMSPPTSASGMRAWLTLISWVSGYEVQGYGNPYDGRVQTIPGGKSYRSYCITNGISQQPWFGVGSL